MICWFQCSCPSNTKPHSVRQEPTEHFSPYYNDMSLNKIYVHLYFAYQARPLFHLSISSVMPPSWPCILIMSSPSSCESRPRHSPCRLSYQTLNIYKSPTFPSHFPAPPDSYPAIHSSSTSLDHPR